jgi:hypothetical protein
MLAITDIYSQNTDNSFGVFESLVGYTFKSKIEGGVSNKTLEFKLMDNGQTLAIIRDYPQYTYIKKTEELNRFSVEGRELKKGIAILTIDGDLKWEERMGDSGERHIYKLTNNGIQDYEYILQSDDKWEISTSASPYYYYFPDQMDNILTNEVDGVGLLVEFGDVYSNESHPLGEFYRAIGLKGTDLKIDLKTNGKTKVTLYDSNGDSIGSVESNANTILSFPITKDDIYFISVLRDDESKYIKLRFRLE